MSDYGPETGEYIYRLTCDCCGSKKNLVWGFISKNGDTHAVYYALLNVTEEEPRVGLTLSVGPWSEGTNPSQRSWVHLNVWSEEDGIHINIRDPKESNFCPWEKGGTGLTWKEAKRSSVIQEIWSVPDFVVDTAPAVTSYLDGNGIAADGRETRQANHLSPSC